LRAECRHPVAAAGLGHRAAQHAAVGVLRGHDNAWQHPALRVGDDTGNGAAATLSEARRRQGQDGRRDQERGDEAKRLCDFVCHD
jgi:hypothetical protein